MVIDDVLSKLDASLRKEIQVGSNFHVERQPTPSIGLNSALRGGFAYGRQVMIYGNKSAGKSTFCLLTIADAQKKGKTCAWIDSENSFDPEWARKLGVDTDQLLVVRAHKVNDIVDIGVRLMEAGIDILVIDSISALAPAVFFDKKDELKDLSETKQMGSMARDMSLAMPMLNLSNKNTLLIVISQQRKMLGSMFVKNAPTGGEAPKFYSSTIIRLTSSESDNQAVKKTIVMGNREIEVPVGREVNWLVEANKLGPAFRSGKYRLMYDGPFVGIDTIEEILTELELNGWVEKSGAWMTLFEERFHGREAVIKALRENEELRQKAMNAIL